MEPADVHARLSARLRSLRAERGFTLEALADRAGVSRSMISLVERGESSPTAAVLDRLAGGLGVTLASLFADGLRVDASPVSRHAEQASWRDPATGYLRRNLSPPSYPSPIELVEVVLPAGVLVAYDGGGSSRAVAVSQQLWILEGAVEVTLGAVAHRLGVGDCLAMPVEGPIAFRTPADGGARYIVALTAGSQQPASAGVHHGGSTP